MKTKVKVFNFLYNKSNAVYVVSGKQRRQMLRPAGFVEVIILIKEIRLINCMGSDICSRANSRNFCREE